MQQLIICDNKLDFQKEIRNSVSDGWIMVPESLTISISSAATSNGWNISKQEVYAIIMQKITNK